MNINLIKLLLKLKNASLVRKEVISIQCNTLCLELLKVLYQEGFIQSFNVSSINSNTIEKQFEITVVLRYFYNKPILKNLKIISTPSYVKYVTLKDLCKIPNKKRVLFLSTNKGFLTGFGCKQKQVGGTLLFLI